MPEAAASYEGKARALQLMQHLLALHEKRQAAKDTLVPPPASPASPAPFQQAAQAVPGAAAEVLGLPDALKAMRGQMSEPESQDFFMSAAMGLLPMKKGLQAATKGIRAYHGSPHDFDRFDLSKIGTGEGAQSYGHGLYFAENPAVATDYRQRLATPSLTATDPIGQKFNPLTHPHPPVRDAAGFLAESGGDIKKALEAWHAHAAKYGTYETGDVGKVLKDWESRGFNYTPGGKMYEVNLKAEPEQFLDLDKGLGEQNPSVQGAVKQAMGTSHTGQFDPAKAARYWQEFQHAQGRDAIKRGFIASDERLASDRLRAAGLPGAKYLDQGSRGPSAALGTSNYVVFDDSIIDILRKYGLAGIAPAAGAASMATQGAQDAGPE